MAGTGRRRGRLGVLVVATIGLMAAFMMLSAGRALAASTPNTALILTDSVTTPGATPTGESLEQYEAEQAGFTVTNVDGTTWDSMTAAQFAQYQVVIIGDPECGDASSFQAAVNDETVWEPVVMSSGGNKALIGTDPAFHFAGGSAPTGNLLVKNGIAYAGNIAGGTGAYVDLSCAYTGSSPGTPVPLLDGLSSHGAGSFTVGGAPCAGAISIIAQSGPTSGLNDSDLSNWSCSVHEFFDKFPTDYTPLALATDPSVPVTYSGTDVNSGATVQGSPYIMISGGGVTVKSNLVLSPPTQTLAQGSAASVTANLSSGGSPVSGSPVTFDISSGPESGQTFTGNTDAAGNVTYTFTNTGGPGTDQIVGTSTVSGVTQQGTAQVTFTASTAPDPPITATQGFTFKCIVLCHDTRTVASFQDPDPSGTASDYTASIDWGDGTSSPGTITLTGGTFFVTGQHGYAASGGYTITVTITDADGPTEPTITANAAIVKRPGTTGPTPGKAAPGTSTGKVVSGTTTGKVVRRTSSKKVHRTSARTKHRRKSQRHQARKR